MKSQPAYEFVFALMALGLITAGYAYLAHDVVPQPNSLIGYTLGTVGFLMMLSTETLYSLRKRVAGFHYGRMSLWLQVHVFTGLVGPYLVLLHSGWRFKGLAGILTMVVAVVVVSGLVGRSSTRPCRAIWTGLRSPWSSLKSASPGSTASCKSEASPTLARPC